MASDNRKGVLYAAATASLWGFMAIVLKVITSELPPVTVVWFRFFFAFLVLAMWTLIFHRSDFRIFLRPPLILILAAIFLGMNYIGFITGIKYVSPSSSQVFIQIGPVCFALSGILIFREHVNWKHIVGFILVLAGMGLFYSEQLGEMTGADEHFTRGMLFVLGGGLSWAIFATLQKVLVKTFRPNQLNLFIYGFNSLVLIPLVSFSSLKGMPAVNWFILIYLGLNTVLAYGSLAMAIKFTEAMRVSVIITLNPIITFVSMAILTRMEVSWLGPETFTIMAFLGALTVLTGALVVIRAGWNKKRAPASEGPLYPAIQGYFSFFFLSRVEVSSINAPKAIMKRPDHRLMLWPSDLAYISASPLVSSPSTVRMIPKMLNISPIGIFISNPIILYFYFTRILNSGPEPWRPQLQPSPRASDTSVPIRPVSSGLKNRPVP